MHKRGVVSQRGAASGPFSAYAVIAAGGELWWEDNGLAKERAAQFPDAKQRWNASDSQAVGVRAPASIIWLQCSLLSQPLLFMVAMVGGRSSP